MLALPWLETTGPHHVGSIKKKVQQQPRSIPHFRSIKSGTTMHHMRLIDTNPLTQLPWSSVVSHSNLSWTTLIALTQYMLWETDTQTAQIATHLTQFQPPIAFDFTSIKKNRHFHQTIPPEVCLIQMQVIMRTRVLSKRESRLWYARSMRWSSVTNEPYGL